MGVFRYPIELGSADGTVLEQFMPLVDTGALYSQFPGSVLRRLGHEANGSRRFRLAAGSVIERPICQVPVRIRAEQQFTICIFGDEGCEMLLGAVTMEEFSLAPDPVNETLNPVIAMLA